MSTIRNAVEIARLVRMKKRARAARAEACNCTICTAKRNGSPMGVPIDILLRALAGANSDEPAAPTDAPKMSGGRFSPSASIGLLYGTRKDVWLRR